MSDDAQLRGAIRVLGLKLDTITAELRTMKAVMMGGSGRRQEAAASHRHRLGGECHEQLGAFEAAFLKAFPSTSPMDLRSSRQAGPEIQWREAFAWLAGHHLPHLTTGQIGTYLGRHPTSIYRQAQRFDPVAEADTVRVFANHWKGEGGG